MSGWEELVSSALVGSERRAVPDTTAAGVTVAGAGRDPAEVLLDRAALLATAQRAGRMGGRAEPLPAAPADSRPLVSAAAGRRLARMLAGGHTDLLEEWLAAAAAAGLRVPEPLLADLLECGRRKEKPLEALIAQVAGRRGQWLAALNPDWAYLPSDASQADGTDPEIWELGSSSERSIWLLRLRAREPAAAREALAASWAKETPKDRAGFLGVLEDGLSAADEPFLEAALDDRRADVRLAAANLLATLPDSALGRRMAERAVPCLRVERRLLRARLVVEPPEACDKATQRDGVSRRPPAGTSERAWWLEQLMTRTPLAAWGRHLGATPAEILRMTMDEWGPVVRRGWERATVLQQDAAWADALLAHQPSAELLRIAEPAARNAHAVSLLSGQARDAMRAAILLQGVPGPWTGKLADLVLARLRKDGDNHWRLAQLSQLAASRLAPDLHDQVAGLEPDPPRPLRDLAGTLRFRHDMLKELESP